MTAFAKANAAGQKTLDAYWYRSPEAFDLERERVFAREWICVGRVEQLQRTGDFFVAEVARESLIVVNDQNGVVRAFFNVCRHRGTRICETKSGHFTGSIQCPYHAWTYALDGRLKVARNMADIDGFSVDDYPLHEARVATWEGFIFVCLANDAPAFEETFGPILHRFSRWHIGDLRTARAIHYDLRCNWKLIFQNYSECYHCPLVHPQLDKLSPSDSGRNDLWEGAFLGGYSELRNHGASLTTSGTLTRPPVGEVDGADIDRVYYYTIFPSLLLSLHPDYVMVHYANPVAPDRTLIDCAWLFDPQTMSRPDFDPSDAADFWDMTNRQDWHVNELTQKGIESRAYTPGVYANAEGLLAAFDRHYMSIMS